MSTKKNLPLIVVILADAKQPVSKLIESAQLVKTTGDPLANMPPVTDTVIHGQASTLETMHTNFKMIPPTATSKQVNQQHNILTNSYNKIALYIQGVARDAAIAAGDVNAGIQVVLRCGFKVKKAKSPVNRQFKVSNAGPGAVDISTKSVAIHAGYVRQYGSTTAKDVPPAVTQELLITLEVDVHINNLKSGTIYAFREAIVLPVKRTTAGSMHTTNTQKMATPTIATKAHKATFSEGAASHYVWSEWIYIVIT
jgi:hypothetical protein